LQSLIIISGTSHEKIAQSEDDKGASVQFVFLIAVDSENYSTCT